MSQDIISDALNKIMNAKKARKSEVVIKNYSKLLINILNLAKEAGFLEYEINGTSINVKIINLNEIKAVKPRYTVKVKSLDKYVRRFLPAKNFGFVIISTNQGIIKHFEAQEKNLGGSVIAYMY